MIELTYKVRVGLEVNRKKIVPEPGEMLATTDGLALYLGDGKTPGGTRLNSGVVYVAHEEDLTLVQYPELSLLYIANMRAVKLLVGYDKLNKPIVITLSSNPSGGEERLLREVYIVSSKYGWYGVTEVVDGGLPYHIDKNSMYRLDNPFGESSVLVFPEVLVKGIWTPVGTANFKGTAFGVVGYYMREQREIVLQTAKNFICTENGAVFGLHLAGASKTVNIRSAQCRVRVIEL